MNTTNSPMRPFMVKDLVQMVMRRKNLIFDDAVSYVYTSDLYKKILDEESKMWYFSASALYEMLEDEKRSKRQHEISDKKLMFRIFSLESYCDYFNIYHEDALVLFREYDVFNFLDDTFEVLHTQDEKYIIDSIKKYISSRRKGR